MEKEIKILPALLLGGLVMCGCVCEKDAPMLEPLSVVPDSRSVVVYPGECSHETLLEFKVEGINDKTSLSVNVAKGLTADISLDMDSGRGTLSLLAGEGFTGEVSVEIIAEDAGRRASATIGVSLALIVLSKDSLVFPSSGGEIVLGVDTNIPCAVSADADWLSVALVRDSMRVACLGNGAGGKREATITLGDGILTESLSVVQEAPLVNGIPASEVAALHAIWDTLNMEDNDDWDFTASIPGSRKPWRDAYPVEEWAGVTVLTIGGESHVVYLAVGGHGTIPPELGDLPYLRELDISQRCGALSGRIPDSLGKLTRLKHLGIVGTGVSGTIPDALSALKELETLGLEDNYLEGNLPAWLARMPRLVNFGFSGNCFDGQVDPSLTKAVWRPTPHGTTGMPLGEYYLSLGQRPGHGLWL